MRTVLIALVLGLALTGTAVAQKRGGSLSEFRSAENYTEQGAARRKSPGSDMKQYGMQLTPKAKPFPWGAVLLALLVGAVATPFGYMMVKSTRRDLEDQATFGLQKGRREEGGEVADKARPRRRPQAAAEKPKAGATSRAAAKAEVEAPPEEPEAAPAADRSPRDAIWDVLAARQDWMSAQQVSADSGLSEPEVADEIGALVEEGYLTESRDARSGKPVFRIA